MVVKAEVAGEFAASTTEIGGGGGGRWLVGEPAEKNGLSWRFHARWRLVMGCPCWSQPREICRCVLDGLVGSGMLGREGLRLEEEQAIGGGLRQGGRARDSPIEAMAT